MAAGHGYDRPLEGWRTARCSGRTCIGEPNRAGWLTCSRNRDGSRVEASSERSRCRSARCLRSSWSRSPRRPLRSRSPNPRKAKPSGRCRRSAARPTEELTQVTVKLYKGSSVSGSPVEAGPSEIPLLGSWTATDETRLKAGKYTAIAEQPDSLLEPGPSEPVTFTVNTKPPTVTLEKLPARSNESKPTFKGTASEPGTVTVHVHEGTGNGGPVATSLTATVSETGEWSVTDSSALADGAYTAVATEPSTIGNPAGESETRTFEVFTHPPAVEFTKVPAERSKVTKPVFEGTTTRRRNRTGRGPHPQGHRSKGATLKATASGGRKWSVTRAAAGGRAVHSPGDAGEPGRKRRGVSEAIEFEIVTAVPKVNLQAIKSRSKVTKPTFRGEASEPGTVMVHVHEGEYEEQGKWPRPSIRRCARSGRRMESESLPPALADGALHGRGDRAERGRRNGTGESESRTFEVFTEPPEVKFTNVPAERSGETKPTFEGTTTPGKPRAGDGPHLRRLRHRRERKRVEFEATLSRREMVVFGVTGASGRELHGAGDRAERDRERPGRERNGGIRNRDRAARRDA